MWRRRSRLVAAWRVAKSGEAVGDTGLSKGVGEIAEGDVKGIGGDGGSKERGGESVAIELVKADEGLGTGEKRTVPESVVVEELRGGCIKGCDD